MNADPRDLRDIVSLLAARAEATPDRVVYEYVGQTAGRKSHTFGSLQRAAWSLAELIREATEPGDRVLLLYPPGLEFIEAFLATVCAGAIAVPAPPPNPHRPDRSLRRLESIVRSARPTVAFTLSNVADALSTVMPEGGPLADVRWIASDRERGAPIAPRGAGPDDIALLQYTSGSTSDPKGVVLRHANVLANIASLDKGWDHDENSVLVSWLPAFHDLGLVYGVLMPIWSGCLGIQMSPIDVIQRPFVWLDTISRFGATHSSGPNFIYDHCVRKISDEEADSLDLSSWRVALTAAEPVRAETLRRFSERFEHKGFAWAAFCPGYGLSEATCKVVATSAEEEPFMLQLDADALERDLVLPARGDIASREVVACGRPGPDIDVRIMHPTTQEPCGSDEVGEIWASGATIAGAYWNQPDATRRSLGARLVGQDKVFLRTGDLGFLREGQLYVTGRIKDLIIVRGSNHYPQDIEYTVQEAHPSVRVGCSAAVSFEAEGEEHLAVVAELDNRWMKALEEGNRPTDEGRPLRTDDVKIAITKAVSEQHGLRVDRVVLLRAGQIPKTTSGKIRRQACKDRLMLGAFHDVGVEVTTSAVDTAYAEALAQISEIVSRCAGIDMGNLQPEASLHGYGLDSLAGVDIAYEIGMLMGLQVPSDLLEKVDSVRGLVDFVLAGEAA